MGVGRRDRKVAGVREEDAAERGDGDGEQLEVEASHSGLHKQDKCSLVQDDLHRHSWFHDGHFHPLAAQVNRHDGYTH